MKKLSTLLLVLLAVILPLASWMPVSGKTSKASIDKQVENVSSFEQAVQIIKKYEGLHSPKHWPLIGYGHLVMPGEKYSRTKPLSEKEAEALLRKDLLKNCAAFREFGKDSLLLGVLAYNIGSGNTKKSSVVKKLKSGDRDIRENYLSHCRYKGKVLSGLKKRRIEEYDALFIKENQTDMALQADTAKQQNSSVAMVTNTENNGENLFASLFSPVSLMLNALYDPIQMASAVIPVKAETTSLFNQPLTNKLCASLI